MLIPSDLLTDEIRATKEYKACGEKFVRVDVLTIQPQPVESTQGTIRTPSTHRTPTLTPIVGDAVQNKRKRKQTSEETSLPKPYLKSRVKQIKISDTPIQQPSDDREREEESYASEFVDSVFQDDDDDSRDRIEPESHKEHPKIVDDNDDETKKEKKDDDETEKEKKDDDNDDDDVNDDHIDHTLDETQEMGSLETRKEKIQTPIPSPLRSPRTDLSLDKDLYQELMVNVAPTPATTSQDPSKTKRISVHLATRSSTVTLSSADLQHQLYLKMKRSLQDRADDIDIDHNDHQDDDAPPEGEKGAKRMKATLRDMMSNQFKDAEEYVYHLEQTKNYMENQIV
ncbi:hypothetical protein Tco_0333504 [Tanacetum coccineum]